MKCSFLFLPLLLLVTTNCHAALERQVIVSEATRAVPVELSTARELLKTLQEVKDKGSATYAALDVVSALWSLNEGLANMEHQLSDSEHKEMERLFNDSLGEMNRIRKADWYKAALFARADRFLFYSVKLHAPNLDNETKIEYEKCLSQDANEFFECYLALFMANLADPERLGFKGDKRKEIAARLAESLQTNLKKFKSFHMYAREQGCILSKEKENYELVMFLIKEMEKKNWLDNPTYKRNGRELRQYLEQL